ncbi:E3 ubiquitin-protein ligase TRIM31 [Rhynchocyon petersi]
MASSQLISTLQEEVICPICLEILRDPVTIDCGHNFCLKCISQTEETEDNLFKCPLCNKSVKRDALRRNLLLANLVEKIEAMSPLELQPKRNELKCQKHQERYHYFCEYDGMFLCSVCCDAKEHKSHKISLTEEAARTYQALVEKERRRIITEFDDLHRVLKEERNFLLSRLAWLSQEGAKEGSVFITSMEAQLKALNSIADTLKIRQQMSPSDLLWGLEQLNQHQHIPLHLFHPDYLF